MKLAAPNLLQGKPEPLDAIFLSANQQTTLFDVFLFKDTSFTLPAEGPGVCSVPQRQHRGGGVTAGVRVLPPCATDYI